MIRCVASADEGAATSSYGNLMGIGSFVWDCTVQGALHSWDYTSSATLEQDGLTERVNIDNTITRLCITR